MTKEEIKFYGYLPNADEYVRIEPMKPWLETDYVHALCQHAGARFPSVRLFRRNVGSMMVDERFFRAGIKGQCDLYAIDRMGSHYEIEVKRFGKLSPAQIAWRDWCLEWGVPWKMLVVHLDELPMQTIERWLGELGEFF